MKERSTPAILSRDEIIKHWLLNLAIEFPSRLTHLFPNFKWGALNARPIPHCPAQDIARNLVELFASGMIAVSSETAEDDVKSRSGFSQILDRFLALRDDYEHEQFSKQRPEMRLAYALTALGGELWEEPAEPEWGRFLSAYTTFPPWGEDGKIIGELVSSDRNLLMAFIGWYPQVRNEGVALETIKWETIADYEALYWKRLPFVYRVSFEVQTLGWRWKDHKVPAWFFDWWTHALHWHKSPWELPDWPSE